MPTRITSTNVASLSKRWGAAVRSALRRRDSNITELAAHVGVSRQHITRVVDGDKPTITVETYLAICEFTGLDPNQHTRTHETTPPWDFTQ